MKRFLLRIYNHIEKISILLFSPFRIIFEKKSDFTVWFLFTILAGQFGILANFIVRYYAYNTNLQQSIYIEATSGSFYTFSIALVASLLGPIFLNFLNASRIQFRTLKTFTVIVSIFSLFIIGIIYASIQSKIPTLTTSPKYSIDITQTIVYIFAITFSAYCYCILGLEASRLNFNNINDPLFNEQNDENVNAILNQEQNINQDPNGIEL